MSLAWTTSQNCTLIANCLPDISTRVSNRHLKLKMSKARCLLFPNPHQTFLASALLNDNPTLLVAQS